MPEPVPGTLIALQSPKQIVIQLTKGVIVSNQLMSLAVLLSLLSVTTTVCGKPLLKRRAAAIAPEATTTAKTSLRLAHPKKSNSTFALRVLLGGALSNGVSDAGTPRATVGFNGDYEFSKHFGIEGSLFYTPKYVQALDSLSGSQSASVAETTTDVSGFAKAKIPFRALGLGIIPKLGMGYQSYSARQEAFGFLAPLPSSLVTDLSVRGFGLLLGTDLYVGAFNIKADYGLGLTTQDPSGTKAASKQLRASIGFRITPSLHLGTEYTYRAIQLESTAESIQQVRYMGFVQVRL